MHRKLRSRLTYANVTATFALFLGLGGGAFALTGVPDRNGVLHGCVSNKTGVLRVVKSASSCRRAKRSPKHRDPGEMAISWNQQGPQGKTGPSGINGINGATNLVVRTQPQVIANHSSAHVDCNPGERAVGGGASFSDGTTSGSKITQSAPAPAGSTALSANGATPTAWEIGFDGNGTAKDVTFFAICASP